MIAALSVAYRDIRQHKWLAARAVLTGAAGLFLLWSLLALRLANLDDWLYLTGLADIRHFWRNGRAVFSHFLIGGALNFTVGWVVGVLHRQHRTSMVLVFFVSLLLLLDLPRVIPAAIEAAHRAETFSSFVGIALMDFLFLRVPILAGGIWCVRPRPSSRLEMNRATL